MARDDWRIRIEIDDGRAGGFLDSLGLDLGSKAHELAKELKEDRLAVSRDGDTIFVYGSSRLQVEQAKRVVEAELEEAHIEPLVVRIEHWLAEEERWDDEPKDETWEDDELADRLEQQGYDVVRRWTYVIVGTATREDADALAQQLHGEVEAGGEVVYEAMPQNPFAIFGGLGG
jgi:hypothetical protein